jgi:hypothetical protein
MARPASSPATKAAPRIETRALTPQNWLEEGSFAQTSMHSGSLMPLLAR